MSDQTIVVVDDELAVRDSLRFLLESKDWSVKTFASGEQFLAGYDPLQIGCLILDLRMPDLSGLEVQRQLASRGYHPPVIFVSAYAEIMSAVQAMKMGACSFLEKPFDDGELLRLVRSSVKSDKNQRKKERLRRDVESRLARLTDRERDLLPLVLRAMPIDELAAAARLDAAAASRNRAQVLKKMGTENEVQLLRLLLEHAPDAARHSRRG